MTKKDCLLIRIYRENDGPMLCCAVGLDLQYEDDARSAWDRTFFSPGMHGGDYRIAHVSASGRGVVECEYTRELLTLDGAGWTPNAWAAFLERNWPTTNTL
jgi:hypothetical protein